MNIKKTIKKGSVALALITGLAACSKNESGAGSESGSLKGSFFISTTTEGDGSIILNTDNLDSGSITTTGQGISLVNNYTNWVFNPNYSIAFGLLYAQGDPGQGTAYQLSSSGTLVKYGSDVQIPDRFTSYGPFDKYIVTSVGGYLDSITTPGVTDTVSVFNLFDLTASNANTRKIVKTSNFDGNNQQATFSGIVDMGNGEFLTGVVMSGTKAADATGGASTGVVLYPDSCWVAAFDENLNLKRLYRDGRQSYASGRYRSQYYSQIAADDDKNCYVFSGAYESTSTKPASALRINNGATEFDQDYYWDIQSASGGYKFRKVWHITGDYFLLEFYNTTGQPSNTTGATQYAVVNMTAKTFHWLSENGFPSKDNITSIGWLTAYNGKAYIPVNTANADPTIYVLDPATGISTKGLVVKAASVTCVGRLTY